MKTFLLVVASFIAWILITLAVIFATSFLSCLFTDDKDDLNDRANISWFLSSLVAAYFILLSFIKR